MSFEVNYAYETTAQIYPRSRGQVCAEYDIPLYRLRTATSSQNQGLGVSEGLNRRPGGLGRGRL